MQKKDITSWVIALVGSKTVIGKRDPVDRSTLSPVYELESGIVQAPTGQTGIAHRCAPICWLPSVDRLEIFSNSTTLIEVSRLSRADQGALERAVEAVEAIVENIRAAQAGIVIAPAEALPRVRLT